MVVLLVSGVLEGFVTPSPLPTWARITIGVVVELLFLAYVFVVGRAAARRGVTGDVGEESGWVMDFGDIKQKFSPIYDILDHHYLNDVPGLENPTSEVVARWIWQQLRC